MPLNAVERRLVQIRERWEAFTGDPARRVLVWECPSSSHRLAECFFEAQKFESEYSTQDLCIVFKEPFEHSIQYSRALKAALADSYEASRDGIAEEGLPADWSLRPEALPDSAYGFVAALRSFGARYHPHIKHLAAVLMPTEVSSNEAFAGWLRRSLDGALPERLRIVALDPEEAPRLRTLHGGDPRILAERLALDMLGVAQEAFAQEQPVGPAGSFRSMLMALVAVVERGTAVQARAKAAEAYSFAGQQGWTDQQAAVAMLVAGAHMKERRHEEALATYRIAGGAAAQASQAGHPAGRHLILQTKLGEAGAQFAAGRPEEAAETYDEAADLALSIPELVIAIEALRMAAFCHARMEDQAGAVARGRRALAVGARLRAEVRSITSLPIAATDLIRVIDPQRAERIEGLRAEGAARTDALLMAAENQAAGLERVADLQRAEAVERGLAAGEASAWRETEARLQRLIAGAGLEFRDSFAAARNLLGLAWPLGAAAAAALASERSMEGAAS